MCALGVESGCVDMYLIKRTTCVVCCVCTSSCDAVGDREVGGEWVGAQE